jgi:hypothetical protein
MDLKYFYTRIFLSAAGVEFDDKKVKEFKALWWWNFRSSTAKGLRLTDEGLEFIKTKAEIRTYSIELPEEIKITAQLLIWMDQQLDSPYHLTKKEITVLKEKAALEIHLFSGDIRKMGYAKSLAKRFNSES